MDSTRPTLPQDVHRLLDDLPGGGPTAATWWPANACPCVDVFETEKTVEIVLDLPGVAADAIRILFKAGVVLIVGEKERPDLSKRGPASFHLVERDFGRFARAVRVNARSTARRRAPGWPTASCASCCRASPSGAAPASSFRSTPRDPRHADETALHRRHRRPPGPRPGAPARARAGRASRRRPGDRQRRERRRRRRHHAREHATRSSRPAST